MDGRMYEDWAIVATIDPIDANNADSSSDAVDMELFEEIMAVVAAGVLDNSTDTDVDAQESDTSGGTYANITGKHIDIAGTDDAKQWIIGVRGSDLTAGKKFVKFTMANSAHSQLLSILVLGRPKYKPATNLDLATVQTPV